MDSTSKQSFKTSIHLNVTDLNSSGQSHTASDYNESDDDDSKLLQFKRVFKHLEDLENNLSELNKYKKNRKPHLPQEQKLEEQQKSLEDRDEPTETTENLRSEINTKIMYFNDKPWFNERYYETLNTKRSGFLSEEASSKILLSSMPSPVYGDTLNRYTLTSDLSKQISSHPYDRYARPTLDERSPFFYGSQSLSSSKCCESYEKKHNKEEELKDEVIRLKTELEDLKQYNSRFYAKTSTLEQKIDDITNTISKKKADTDLINDLVNKSPTINYEFNEKDRVLNDMCQSKLLLEKTSYLTSKTGTNSFITRRSPSCQQINHFNNNSVSYGTQSSSSNVSIKTNKNESPSLRPILVTNSKRVSSLNGIDPIKNGVQIEFCPLKKDIDQLKVELNRAQKENLELKKKLLQHQGNKLQEPGVSIPIVNLNSDKEPENQKQTSSKSIPDLPKEVILNNEASSKLSKEQKVIHKQTLQSVIQDLTNQNQNLRIRLQKLQGSNAKGLEKLKYFYNENNKLKTELKLLSTRKSNETSNNSKSHYDLQTEISNLNTKLKFEQEQRDELKRRHEIEINSVKIRYDNELEKQNKLMQLKNDKMAKEIEKLNESIKKLQDEKIALLMKLKSDVLENTELKSTSSTSKTCPSSFNDCSQSSKHSRISDISISLESFPNSSIQNHHCYTFDLSNKIPTGYHTKATSSPLSQARTTYEFTILSPLVLD